MAQNIWSHKLFLPNIALAAMTSLAPMTSRSSSDHRTNSPDTSSITTPITMPIADSIVTLSPVKNTRTFPLLKTAYTHCDADKYAAIVIDAVTGDMLYGYNHNTQRYPASLTKMMTAFLAFEALDNNEIALFDTLHPAKTIAGYKTDRDLVTLSLKQNETISVKQAFDGMMVVSAADATEMLATHVAGDTVSFVNRMNERATELGMTNTHFTNTTGAPDKRQTSTAKDMAILLRALMQYYPHHMHILNQKTMTFGGTTYKNHSALPGMDIGKTGFIEDSRYNIAVSGAPDSLHRTITVMFGGKNSILRKKHVADIQKSVTAQQRSAYPDSLVNKSAPFPLFPKQKHRFDPQKYQHNALDLIKPRPYRTIAVPLKHQQIGHRVKQPVFAHH
jgi:D-alanyl-D-alanine carboxypeptidase